MKKETPKKIVKKTTKTTTKQPIKKTKTVKKAKTIKKAQAPTLPTDTQKLLRVVTKLLEDNKAQDVLTISLIGKTTLADALVIASGTSTRHVISTAIKVAEELKKKGFKPRLEGRQSSGDWIIIDLNDIIVHIFHPQARAFYDLEKLWSYTKE